MTEEMEIKIAALLERLVLAVEQISLEMDRQPTPDAPAHVPQYPAAGQWVCPVHGSFKVVPAGVSKKTGLAYESFTACPAAYCKERPPRMAQLLP